MQLEALTEIELEIYSRQLLVKGFGLEQQLALKKSAVFLNFENEVAARYLIAAGVGRIFIKSSEIFETLKNQNPTVSVELFNSYQQLPENCIEVINQGEKSQFVAYHFISTDNELLDGILISSALINKITATS